MAVHPSLRPVALAFTEAGGSDRLTDVVIFQGAGVPSGGTLSNGQTLDSGQSAIYLRTDPASVSTLVYVTIDGGSTWTALAVP